MSVFTSAPYSLTAGQLITVTVQAYNSIGNSSPSTANTAGVIAITAPTASPTPISGSSTS
jgi:hypothetical protein